MDEPQGGTLFDQLPADRTDEVLAVVARIISGKAGASDWVIQKLYYLACVESIEDRLELLPSPGFFSWNHGPWSKDLRALLELSTSAGDIEVLQVRSKYRAITTLYRWPQSKPVPSMAGKAGPTFLDPFLRRLSRLPGEMLTDLAKNTFPYRRTPFGQIIDLEGYLEERKRGLDVLSDDVRLATLLAERSPARAH
jgi:hypothetical protein